MSKQIPSRLASIVNKTKDENQHRWQVVKDTTDIAQQNQFVKFLENDHSIQNITQKEGQGAIEIYISAAVQALNSIQKLDPTACKVIRQVLDFFMTDSKIKPKELDQAVLNLRELQNIKQTLESQIEDLQYYLRFNRDEGDKLKTDLVEAEEKIQKYSMQNEKLEVELQEAKKKIAYLDSSFDEERKEGLYSRLRKNDAMHRQNQLIAKQIDLQTFIEKLKWNLKNEEQKSQDLIIINRDLLIEQDSIKQTLEQSRNELKSQLEKKEQIITTLENDNVKYKLKSQAYKDDIESYETIISQLKKQNKSQQLTVDNYKRAMESPLYINKLASQKELNIFNIEETFEQVGVVNQSTQISSLKKKLNKNFEQVLIDPEVQDPKVLANYLLQDLSEVSDEDLIENIKNIERDVEEDLKQQNVQNVNLDKLVAQQIKKQAFFDEQTFQEVMEIHTNQTNNSILQISDYLRKDVCSISRLYRHLNLEKLLIKKYRKYKFQYNMQTIQMEYLQQQVKCEEIQQVILNLDSILKTTLKNTRGQSITNTELENTLNQVESMKKSLFSKLQDADKDELQYMVLLSQARKITGQIEEVIDIKQTRGLRSQLSVSDSFTDRNFESSLANDSLQKQSVVQFTKQLQKMKNKAKVSPVKFQDFIKQIQPDLLIMKQKVDEECSFSIDDDTIELKQKSIKPELKKLSQKSRLFESSDLLLTSRRQSSKKHNEIQTSRQPTNKTSKLQSMGSQVLDSSRKVDSSCKLDTSDKIETSSKPITQNIETQTDLCVQMFTGNNVGVKVSKKSQQNTQQIVEEISKPIQLNSAKQTIVEQKQNKEILTTTQMFNQRKTSSTQIQQADQNLQTQIDQIDSSVQVFEDKPDGVDCFMQTVSVHDYQLTNDPIKEFDVIVDIDISKITQELKDNQDDISEENQIEESEEIQVEIPSQFVSEPFEANLQTDRCKMTNFSSQKNAQNCANCKIYGIKCIQLTQQLNKYQQQLDKLTDLISEQNQIEKISRYVETSVENNSFEASQQINYEKYQRAQSLRNLPSLKKDQFQLRRQIIQNVQQNTLKYLSQQTQDQKSSLNSVNSITDRIDESITSLNNKISSQKEIPLIIDEPSKIRELTQQIYQKTDDLKEKMEDNNIGVSQFVKFELEKASDEIQQLLMTSLATSSSSFITEQNVQQSNSNYTYSVNNKSYQNNQSFQNNQQKGIHFCNSQVDSTDTLVQDLSDMSDLENIGEASKKQDKMALSRKFLDSYKHKLNQISSSSTKQKITSKINQNSEKDQSNIIIDLAQTQSQPIICKNKQQNVNMNDLIQIQQLQHNQDTNQEPIQEPDYAVNIQRPKTKEYEIKGNKFVSPYKAALIYRKMFAQGLKKNNQNVAKIVSQAQLAEKNQSGVLEELPILSIDLVSQKFNTDYKQFIDKVSERLTIPRIITTKIGLSKLNYTTINETTQSLCEKQTVYWFCLPQWCEKIQNKMLEISRVMQQKVTIPNTTADSNYTYIQLPPDIDIKPLLWLIKFIRQFYYEVNTQYVLKIKQRDQNCNMFYILLQFINEKYGIIQLTTRFIWQLLVGLIFWLEQDIDLYYKSELQLFSLIISDIIKIKQYPFLKYYRELFGLDTNNPMTVQFSELTKQHKLEKSDIILKIKTIFGDDKEHLDNFTSQITDDLEFSITLLIIYNSTQMQSQAKNIQCIFDIYQTSDLISIDDSFEILSKINPYLTKQSLSELINNQSLNLDTFTSIYTSIINQPVDSLAKEARKILKIADKLYLDNDIKQNFDDIRNQVLFWMSIQRNLKSYVLAQQYLTQVQQLSLNEMKNDY